MPLQNVRYRVKTTKAGEKIRLAFSKKSGTVVEAKNLGTGAMHTPTEFAKDRKKSRLEQTLARKRA